METNITGTFLNVVNALVLVLNAMTVLLATRKMYSKDTRSFDYSFYLLMFMWSSYFFISNCLAAYRGYQTFILGRIRIPEDLAWATYVDRCGMLLTALTGYLLCRKYIVEWFFNEENKKSDS